MNKKYVNSVLALKYDNLEIIVSDDCSKDSTYQIVQDIVANEQSSHHIIINRNEVNLGLASNFNKTFGELATGDFLVTLGGDDVIVEDYLSEAVAHFSNHNDLMMLDYNATVIDENDNIKGLATNLSEQKISRNLRDYLTLKDIPSFAPGRIFRNELVRNFNPISSNCPTEDSVLVIRALLLGKHWRLNRKVIHYRKHSNNISSIDNLKKLSNIRIITQYVKDAIHLYDNLFFSDAEILAILRRFSYELKRRNIFYSDQNIYLKRLKLQFNKRKYLFKIK